MAQEDDRPLSAPTYATIRRGEDVDESYVPYMIVRHRAPPPAGMVGTINVTIPHRIAYFDAELEGASWCPVVPDDCP